MAIEGIQVPMYKNTYYFCIFLIFQFFILFLYEKQNKAKLKKKKNKNKNILNKAMHKNRLTQNNKAKHTSDAKQKQEEEREKVTESLGALFLPHL